MQNNRSTYEFMAALLLTHAHTPKITEVSNLMTIT